MRDTLKNALTILIVLVNLCFVTSLFQPATEDVELFYQKNTDEESHILFTLIDKGKELQQYSDSNEIVLLIGNNEEDKATLARFLADGNNIVDDSSEDSYIVCHEDGKISTTYKIPKSTYPSLFIHSKKSFNFLVSPPFALYNPLAKITSTYFLKNVLKYIRKMKLIFVADYKLFQHHSFKEILLALKSSSGYIKNFKSFENSIVFVITKSETISSGMISTSGNNTQMKEDVLEVLRKIRTVIGSNNDRIQEALLLDALLKAGDHQRIAVLTLPSQTSGINKERVLEAEKIAMLNLLTEASYADVSIETFNFNVSEEAHDVLSDFHGIVSRNINKNLADISRRIKNYYEIYLESSNDIFQATEESISSLDKLKHCIHYEKLKLKNILNCFSKHHSDNNNLATEQLKLIRNVNYYKIYKSLSPEKPETTLDPLICALTNLRLDLSELLTELIVWQDIYNKLYVNNYLYKNQLTKYNQLQPTIDQGDTDLKQIHTFLKKHNTLRDLSITKDLDLSKIIILKNIMRFLNSSEFLINCDESKRAFVIGNFVVLSHIETEDLCSATEINIFAFNKLFVDKMPTMLNSTNIILISPDIEYVNFNLRKYLDTWPKNNKFWSFGMSSFSYIRSNECHIFQPCDDIHFIETREIWHEPLNRFKKYLVRDLNQTIDKTRHLNFLNIAVGSQFADSKQCQSLSLFGEFMELETESYNFKIRKELSKIYQSLGHRIKMYYQNICPEERMEEYSVLLKHLYVSVLAKIFVLRLEPRGLLVTDIGSLIKNRKDLLLNSIDNVSGNQLLYMHNFNIIFNSGEIFLNEEGISAYLLTKSKDILENTNAEISSTLENIKKVINNEDLLNNRIGDLKKYTEKKIVMDNLIVIVRALDYLFSFTNLSTKLIESIDTPAISSDKTADFKVGYNQTLHELKILEEESFTHFKNIFLDIFISKINIAIDYLNEKKVESISLIGLRRLGLQLTDAKLTKNFTLSNITQAETTLNSNLKSIKQAIKKQRKYNGNVDEILGDLEILISTRPVETLYEDNHDILEHFSKVLEGKNYILKVFPSKINSILLPEIEAIHRFISKVSIEPALLSEFDEIMHENKLNIMLKELKREIQNLAHTLEPQEELPEYLEEIYEAIDRLQYRFKVLSTYNLSRKLYNSVLSFKNDTSLKNSTVKGFVNDIDNIIKKNILLSIFEDLVLSINQYMYPFFIRLSLLQSFSQEQKINESLIDFIKEMFDIIKKQINDELNKRMYSTAFQANTTDTYRFYTWRNGKFRHSINKLLLGEKVMFKSDITRSQSSMNPIKFKTIGIHFEAKDKSLQKHLEQVLTKFSYRLTHLGNSYYKCNNKYHVVYTEPTSINRSFAVHRNTHTPVNFNMIYDKMMKGYVNLSPYTMWFIQLVADEHTKELEQFLNKVELDLVGEALFVPQENLEECESELENIHEAVNPVYDFARFE